MQLPEKEIDAVPELPKLVDLKASTGANQQVEYGHGCHAYCCCHLSLHMLTVFAV